MTIPDQAFDTYLAIWIATDDERCRALVEEALTEDIVVLYPSFEAYGRAAVVTAARRFYQDHPGVQVTLISGIEHHHSRLRGAWRMQYADGSAMGHGQTILELAEDGRVRRATGFYDPLPERP